jgi:polysaccharide export outer membrane protein
MTRRASSQTLRGPIAFRGVDAPIAGRGVGAGIAGRAARASLSLVLLLSACGSLPSSGPSNDEVLDKSVAEHNTLGIHLVDLTPAAVQALRDRPEPSLSIIDTLRTNRPVDLLGPGDVISVSIYEAGNGLFNTQRSQSTGEGVVSGSSAETLPRLLVDRSGLIMVPYAGEINVAGKTTTQVQRIIEDRLADKAADPQVVVSVLSNSSNIVYISGDVRLPGRYPLSLAHETVLDIIALAGGPTHSPQDTVVKVNRRGREATTSLTRIQTIAAENIPVEPQDRIQADYLPRTYISFGATGRVAQLQFDSATVSLAEAVARVGGLDDNRANPEAVYLFRFERPANARTLGLNQAPAAPAALDASASGVPASGSSQAGGITPVSAAPLPPPPPAMPVSSAPAIPGAMPQGIPVIYKVNMRDPETYFAIQQFAMQDKDIIYIANAPTVQLNKFLQLLYTVVTPAVTAKTLSP